MRTGPSMDHNQMLVVSVFLHLLVITIIMFLPKQKIQQKIIVPAFNFDIVDIPARRKEAPKGVGETAKPKPEVVPPSEKTEEVKPVPKAEEVKPAPKAEEVKPAPKAEKAPAPKPEKKAAPPVPEKKPEPLKPKATSKIVEELERLDGKSKETALVKELDQLAKLKPPETYKNLDELKKRKTQPQKPPPAKESPEKEDLAEHESEFDVLAKKSVEPKKENADKTAAELIKEFQRTAELDTLKTQNLKSEAAAKKVDLAMSAGQPFSSALHKKTEAPGTGKTASQDKQTDALSLYVGVIKERIYSNWKNPLGAETREVYVSFFLYSQGNIGKPFIEKSSGNEKLDSLAIRAILDSDPFPKFPLELKEPSLHMMIRFKYIPQD